MGAKVHNLVHKSPPAIPSIRLVNQSTYSNPIS